MSSCPLAHYVWVFLQVRLRKKSSNMLSAFRIFLRLWVKWVAPSLRRTFIGMPRLENGTFRDYLHIKTCDIPYGSYQRAICQFRHVRIWFGVHVIFQGGVRYICNECVLPPGTVVSFVFVAARWVDMYIKKHFSLGFLFDMTLLYSFCRTTLKPLGSLDPVTLLLSDDLPLGRFRPLGRDPEKTRLRQQKEDRNIPKLRS